MSALSRYLLLAGWSNTGQDFGSTIFRLGKCLGIAGRVLGLLCAIVAVIGALVSPTVLLFLAYGAGFAVVIAVLIEVCARLLMLGGNSLSSRHR